MGNLQRHIIDTKAAVLLIPYLPYLPFPSQGRPYRPFIISSPPPLGHRAPSRRGHKHRPGRPTSFPQQSKTSNPIGVATPVNPVHRRWTLTVLAARSRIPAFRSIPKQSYSTFTSSPPTSNSCDPNHAFSRPTRLEYQGTAPNTYRQAEESDSCKTGQDNLLIDTFRANTGRSKPTVPLGLVSSRDMSGTMSKRQQARNEKVLHELAQAPGNNVCADCSARNPCMFPPIACYDGFVLNLPLFTSDSRLTHLSLPQLGHHGAYVYIFLPSLWP